MGTDIDGWIEVRQGNDWHGVVKVGSLADRSYDVFSCLFGVTDYARFVPVAPDRGLPADASEEAADDYLTWEKPFGESWVSWPEIQAIDWQESALDSRPHAYRQDASGQLVYVSKSAPRTGEVIEEGSTWQGGERLCRVERITRGSTLDDARGWRCLLGLMALLASEYGDANVRLVVWFYY
jgi:hypothetical protein